MLTKVILIFVPVLYFNEAAVIKGDSFDSASKIFPGQIFDGTAYQRCSVGEGEVRGNITDDRITETSGLAYSRRSEGVDIHHL